MSGISLTHAEVEAAKLLIEVLERLERDIDPRLRVIADAVPANLRGAADDASKPGGSPSTTRPKLPDRPIAPQLAERLERRTERQEPRTERQEPRTERLERRTERLELRVPATLAQLPAVRAMAGDLATRMDFDLDHVENLRLAVDEACATLAQVADGDAPMTVVFEGTRAGLHIDAWIPTVAGTDVPRDGFGWSVLETLSDEVNAGPATQETVPGGNGTSTPVAVISMDMYLPGRGRGSNAIPDRRTNSQESPSAF
jgi:serine/threonine-protein kinase RsbW